MPRTRRYIFNTFTVVSLLLMLRIVGFWVFLGDSEIGITLAREQPWQVARPTPRTLLPGVRIFHFVTQHGINLQLSVSCIYGVLIFAILPAIWLYKWNKRRKLGPNACLGCGYDLTGNESGVCPECGVATENTFDTE